MHAALGGKLNDAHVTVFDIRHNETMLKEIKFVCEYQHVPLLLLYEYILKCFSRLTKSQSTTSILRTSAVDSSNYCHQSSIIKQNFHEREGFKMKFYAIAMIVDLSMSFICYKKSNQHLKIRL